MKFDGGGRYRVLLDELEQRSSGIMELRALQLPVDVLEQFEDFRRASGSNKIGASPALFQKSCRRIFINHPEFTVLKPAGQAAVMMHGSDMPSATKRGSTRFRSGRRTLKRTCWSSGGVLERRSSR
jgi:hypothetical protein